ncbi:MAG: hypothetical protein WC786_03470 [Patescibacteria group bacterium]|jgi:sRNA-binding carbon storage regulator CsrA
MPLNLTVKPGEQTTLDHKGAKCVIVVNSCSKSSVNLSFNGSKKFKIYRQDIQEAIDRKLAERNKHFPYNAAIAVKRALKALLP